MTERWDEIVAAASERAERAAGLEDIALEAGVELRTRLWREVDDQLDREERRDPECVAAVLELELVELMSDLNHIDREHREFVENCLLEGFVVNGSEVEGRAAESILASGGWGY